MTDLIGEGLRRVAAAGRPGEAGMVRMTLPASLRRRGSGRVMVPHHDRNNCPTLCAPDKQAGSST